MNVLHGISIRRQLIFLIAVFAALIVSGSVAVYAADPSPAVTGIEYVPAKAVLSMDKSYDLVDGYWDMEHSDLHPSTTLDIHEPSEGFASGFVAEGDPSDGIHSGDRLTVHYDNGETRVYTACTYFVYAGGGSMEYAHVIAWLDAENKPADIDASYSYENYPEKDKDGLKIPGTYDTKVTVSYAGQQAEYSMKITVTGKRKNPVKVTPKTITVKASQLKKHSKTIARKQAMTVKNAKGTMHFRKLSGNRKLTINKKTGKIKIAKNLKKGTYKLKVRITCDGNSKYLKATRTVIIKVKVR